MKLAKLMADPQKLACGWALLELTKTKSPLMEKIAGEAKKINSNFDYAFAKKNRKVIYGANKILAYVSNDYRKQRNEAKQTLATIRKTVEAVETSLYIGQTVVGGIKGIVKKL